MPTIKSFANAAAKLREQWAAASRESRILFVTDLVGERTGRRDEAASALAQTWGYASPDERRQFLAGVIEPPTGFAKVTGSAGVVQEKFRDTATGHGTGGRKDARG